MYTGRTIEQLIATVARVDAEVDKTQKPKECGKFLRFPVIPIPQNATWIMRTGA